MTRTTNPPCRNSRVLGIMFMSLFCLFLKSNSCAFTLANCLTYCWSTKSSLWFWLLVSYFVFKHIDTHYKSSVSKFPCPGNHDHVLFFIVLNSSSVAFTLANCVTNVWSMKYSSVMLTSCVLFLLLSTSVLGIMFMSFLLV